MGQGLIQLHEEAPVNARMLFTEAARLYAEYDQHLALAWAHHNIGVTLLDDPYRALHHLFPAWKVMRAITWGLPEVEARARWRDRTAQSVEAVLDAAQRTGDALLVAELVESQRTTTFTPAASMPAGISSPVSAVEDLLTVEPPRIDFGWPSRLRALATKAVKIEHQPWRSGGNLAILMWPTFTATP